MLLLTCLARSENCVKKDEKKCGGRIYSLSTELARVAQLPVGSTVCRTHWDEIRRNSERCSVPRASHSRILRKPSIPTTLLAVLDAVGRERKEEYRPGTRWCTECSTQVDILIPRTTVKTTGSSVSAVKLAHA